MFATINPTEPNPNFRTHSQIPSIITKNSAMATLIFPEHPSPVADAEALKKACQGNPLMIRFFFFSPSFGMFFGSKDEFFFSVLPFQLNKISNE